MKTIQVKENGQYTGLVINYETEHDAEHIVGQEQLKKLQPYVLQLLESSKEAAFTVGWLYGSKISEKLKIVAIDDTKAAFALDGIKDGGALLSKIKEICKTSLTEKIIVPQYMGPDGEGIRHRVMHFEVEKDQLVVRYIKLGDFNTFDAAMKDIAELYPKVLPSSDEHKGK